MSLDLEVIKARLAAATPGPWRHEYGACDTGNNHSVLFGDAALNQFICRSVSGRGNFGGPERSANAALIANAPTDIAALLADIEVLERIREELSGAAARFARETTHLRAEIEALRRREDDREDLATRLERASEELERLRAEHGELERAIKSFIAGEMNGEVLE